MFSHVMLGANDIEKSKKFYDAVLATLGVNEGKIDPKGRVFYRTKTGVFALSKPIDGKDACNGNGSTVGFSAASLEQVKAFHAAGLAHGGTAIEDPPGPRPGQFGVLNLCYLRDPAGNKICALHREG